MQDQVRHEHIKNTSRNTSRKRHLVQTYIRIMRIMRDVEMLLCCVIYKSQCCRMIFVLLVLLYTQASAVYVHASLLQVIFENGDSISLLDFKNFKKKNC